MVLSFVNVIFVRCVAEVGLRGAVGAQGKMKLAGCHAGCVAVRVYMCIITIFVNLDLVLVNMYIY